MRLSTLYILLLSALLQAGCHKPYYIAQRKDSVIAVKDASADSSYIRFLAPYKQQIDATMQVIVGTTDTILTKAQPECTLGNFMVDAILAAAKQKDNRVMAAVTNYGGIRLPYINAGNITTGKLFELMPFDNAITVIEVPGDSLISFCNHIAAAKGWPVSGIRFAIKDGKAQDIFVNGKPIDNKQMYYVATSDYLSTGGDKCSFLIPLKATPVNVLLRDALIAYVKNLQQANKPLHPYIEKRVHYVE